MTNGLVGVFKEVQDLQQEAPHGPPEWIQETHFCCNEVVHAKSITYVDVEKIFVAAFGRTDWPTDDKALRK